jgi:hypothetical protein
VTTEAFIDTYVRRGKWWGSDPLEGSVLITFVGFDRWDLSQSLRADDPTSGFQTNHGVLLRYRLQNPPAGLQLDESGIIEFRVLATIDNANCSTYKILMFNRY